MSTLLPLWYRYPMLFWLLRPLSWLFGAVIFLRRQAYAFGLLSSYVMPVPVVVVGNIEIGGSGKTPFVIALVKALQDEGFRPGVVSKGYGRREKTVAEVFHDSVAKYVGDEALLIKRQAGCPVFVGKYRVEAARALLQEHECDVIVSDDGLQHYALCCDMTIALDFVNSQYKNHALLPAGPYREPRSRFAAMDFHLCHGDGYSDVLFTMGVPYCLSSHGHPNTKSWSEWQGHSCYALAGIAKPERFYQGLRAQGLNVQAIYVPDHGQIEEKDLADIPGDATILMTEKDALKYDTQLSIFSQRSVWVVPFSATIAPGVLLSILQKLRDVF